MTTLRITSIVLVAALISSCSTGDNAAEVSPSSPETSSSPSVEPSPSTSIPVEQQGLDLDPVPFFFAPVDATSQNLPDWMSRLSTIQMTADGAAYNAEVGILATVFVLYTPIEGEPLSIFQVDYMPEDVYAGFQNMDGPQEVGNQVLSVDGNVMGVFGPQGDLFEPGSVDQDTINEIIGFAYNPQSYQPTIN